jgi:hypothetical protein
MPLIMVMGGIDRAAVLFEHAGNIERVKGLNLSTFQHPRRKFYLPF